MSKRCSDSPLSMATVAVEDALVGLEPFFLPTMRLTFIAADPDDPERDFCITSATPAELLSAARRIAGRESGEK